MTESAKVMGDKTGNGCGDGRASYDGRATYYLGVSNQWGVGNGDSQGDGRTFDELDHEPEDYMMTPWVEGSGSWY